MENNNKNFITRFAPSPTGFMHVGGVRTALFAWLLARKNNGKFILRIEDTDKSREVDGSIDHIVKSLKWLGLDWDVGPSVSASEYDYLQSARLDIYTKYAKQLEEKGLAYADPYSEEELENFRKEAEDKKELFLFRKYRPENPAPWDGTKPLRLKTEPKTYKWNDMVRGELSAGVEAIDDFVLFKSDGYPTYNFAHIIDDFEMGVTHILRSDEFISSTPKYLALYEALGIKRPEFVMLPPIMSDNGKKKLGKRDGAKDAMDYAQMGILPQAMMNFLAFIGWNPGTEKEIYTAQELINDFDISKIQSSGGKFNEEKLLWVNKQHINLITFDEQVSYVKKYLKNNYPEDIIFKMVPIIIERIHTFSEVALMEDSGELDFFVNCPLVNVEKLYYKNDKQINLSKILSEINKILETTDDAQETKSKIMSVASEFGNGPTLHPLRYLLSGLDKSPDPFTIIQVIGKEEAISRISSVLKQL